MIYDLITVSESLNIQFQKGSHILTYNLKSDFLFSTQEKLKYEKIEMNGVHCLMDRTEVF